MAARDPVLGSSRGDRQLLRNDLKDSNASSGHARDRSPTPGQAAPGDRRCSTRSARASATTAATPPSAPRQGVTHVPTHERPITWDISPNPDTSSGIRSGCKSHNFRSPEHGIHSASPPLQMSGSCGTARCCAQRADNCVPPRVPRGHAQRTEPRIQRATAGIAERLVQRGATRRADDRLEPDTAPSDGDRAACACKAIGAARCCGVTRQAECRVAWIRAVSASPLPFMDAGAAARTSIASRRAPAPRPTRPSGGGCPRRPLVAQQRLRWSWRRCPAFVRRGHVSRCVAGAATEARQLRVVDVVSFAPLNRASSSRRLQTPVFLNTDLRWSWTV